MSRLLEEVTGTAGLPVSALLVIPVNAGAAGSVAASSYGSGASTVSCDVEEGVWNTVAADAIFVELSLAPPSASGAGIAVDGAGDDCMPPDDVSEVVTVPMKEDWTIALP